MTQVTSVSDEDVLRWSRNLLDRRKVSDLDNFIQLRGITLPDLNDSSRRGRRGLIINTASTLDGTISWRLVLTAFLHFLCAHYTPYTQR